MTCPRCQRGVSPVDVFCGFCHGRLEASLPDPAPRAATPVLAAPSAPARPPAGEADDDLLAAPPAGFWVRGGAAAVDAFLLALWFGLVWSAAMGATLAGVAGSSDPTALLAAAERSDDLAPVVAALFAGVVLAYLMAFAVFEGATPGKMVFRLRVVGTDGGALGVPRAFLREALGRLAVVATLGIGFVAVALHPGKRGLHDLLGRTQVVRLP